MNTKARFIRWMLLTSAIAVFSPIPAGAATIDVNTTSDTIADDGACSLREAVIAANTNTASGATAGECIAGEAVPIVDVINIPAGTYTLTIAPSNNNLTGADPTYYYGEYTLSWNGTTSTYDATVTPDASNGDLDITESVNLVGADMATTIIDAGWIPNGAVNDPAVDPDAGSTPGLSDRVLHVINATDDVDVQISGLTIKGGRTPEVTGLTHATVPYNLRINGGGLAVGTGAGTYDASASATGGAPVIESGTGGPAFTLDMSNVLISQNYAGDGGGLYNGAETATVDMVKISGNHGYANGGGMYNDGGLTLTKSTIDGNGAEGGGGIFDTGNGTRTIDRSTLSNNGAVGGGAYSGRAGITMYMTNSTVSGNIARDMGGGLLTNGILDLVHVTVANNTATTDAPNAGGGIMTFPSGSAMVIMRDVLLNNNLMGTVAPLTNADCGGVGGGTIRSTSAGYNLSQDTSCGLGDTSDYNSVDAMLLALADNGGPTLTQALPANSTAVNNGGPLGAVTVDQRGVARDSAPDIGAYEYKASTSGSSSSSDSKNIFGCSLGNPKGFDPTLLFVVLGSLFYLGRRKLKEAENQKH
jgi:CSLREA domain-containing protein